MLKPNIMVATDFGEGWFDSEEASSAFMRGLVRSGIYRGLIEERVFSPKSGMLYTATVARGPADYEVAR